MLSLSDCLLEHQHNDPHNYYLLKLKKKKKYTLEKPDFCSHPIESAPGKDFRLGVIRGSGTVREIKAVSLCEQRRGSVLLGNCLLGRDPLALLLLNELPSIS